MLQEIHVGPQSIEDYRPIVGHEVLRELYALAQPLKGVRVAHINATAYGGGVAELLRSLIPLYRDLGIDAHWQVIRGDEAFFQVTKQMHNTLQGAEYSLTSKDKDTYLAYGIHNARLLDAEFDYVIVHDPQPAALRHFHSNTGGKWVWRCHIDTSAPNPETWSFLSTFTEEYDAHVFTMREFAPSEIRNHTVFIPPGIDPLSPKNRDIPMDLCRKVVDWIGLEHERPFILQVSRFDPWKDPRGVIQVYRQVREEIPALQMVLLGSMADDDPEGWEVSQSVMAEAQNDRDIHVHTNLTGVSNLEVNAFQRLASVALQKSIREGFGLVVSETLWKGTPIVVSRAGGIPMQIPVGCEQYLVENVEEAAQEVLALLQDTAVAQAYGQAGREHVRNYFMITRLLRDELNLLLGLR